MNDFKQKLISDIRVKLTEEFDRNFERKAFFDRRWPRRRVEHGKGSLLVVTGTLRRSICSTTTRNGVRTAEVGVRLHLVTKAEHFEGYEDGRRD